MRMMTMMMMKRRRCRIVSSHHGALLGLHFRWDRMAATWLCWSTHRVVVGAAALDACQQEYRPLEARDTRRSRTAARSESSTSPNHRPPIESSSSSTPCASSMMVHVDDDLDAKRTWRLRAIDWLQSHALDSLP